MKRWLIWLTLVTLVALASWWVAPTNGQERQSRWHWGDARECRSVVRIVGSAEADVRGSGVIIRWNGKPRVLTAAHVVRGLQTIIVHLHDRRWFIGRVTAIDSTKDLALLDMGDVTGLESVEVEYLSPPARGDELTLLGFGSDDRLAYDTGAVRKFVMMGSANARAIDLPCHARPGDSGGPVFNSSGRVVGIVSAANPEPTAIVSMCYGWFPAGQQTLVKNGDPVLLDFYADWCAPCRESKTDVDDLIKVGYKVRKINVDVDPDMAAKYSVKRLPCFVLLYRGQEIERTVGKPTAGRLREMFRRVVTQQVYTGNVPDRVVINPGTLKAGSECLTQARLKSVEVADAAPTQCSPGGCPIPQRRPGLGVNREGIEINGMLPWNKQKDQPPVIIQPPQPPAGPDPAVQAQLDAINSKLDSPPPLPPTPPVIEPEPEFSATAAIIAAALGFGLVFLIHYAREKRS